MSNPFKNMMAGCLIAIALILSGCEGLGGEGGLFGEGSAGTTTVSLTMKFSEFDKPVTIEAPAVPTSKDAEGFERGGFGGRGPGGFGGSLTVSPNARAELSTVQTAIDSAMADAGVTTIQAQADSSPNRVWTSLPKKSDGTALAIAGGTVVYMRATTTEWGYCWDTTGKVKQILEKDSTQCTTTSRAYPDARASSGFCRPGGSGSHADSTTGPS